MSRRLSLFVVCAAALVFVAPGRAQDSPPLGDIARQAQKDKTKANKPSAKVITDEDLPSKSGGIAPNLSAIAPSAAGASSAPIQSPQEGLSQMQAALDHLDSLDRAGLALEVLNGNTASFPGRVQWEQKLFAAKQSFVSRTRAILRKVDELSASAASFQGSQDPNDPRVKNLSARLQEMVQESQQNGEAFNAVAEEGKQRAAEAPAK